MRGVLFPTARGQLPANRSANVSKTQIHFYSKDPSTYAIHACTSTVHIQRHNEDIKGENIGTGHDSQMTRFVTSSNFKLNDAKKI